jgi:hypothetical protein
MPDMGAPACLKWGYQQPARTHQACSKVQCSNSAGAGCSRAIACTTTLPPAALILHAAAHLDDWLRLRQGPQVLLQEQQRVEVACTTVQQLTVLWGHLGHHLVVVRKQGGHLGRRLLCAPQVVQRHCTQRHHSTGAL